MKIARERIPTTNVRFSPRDSIRDFNSKTKQRLTRIISPWSLSFRFELDQKLWTNNEFPAIAPRFILNDHERYYYLLQDVTSIQDRASLGNEAHVGSKYRVRFDFFVHRGVNFAQDSKSFVVSCKFIVSLKWRWWQVPNSRSSTEKDRSFTGKSASFDEEFALGGVGWCYFMKSTVKVRVIMLRISVFQQKNRCTVVLLCENTLCDLFS